MTGAFRIESRLFRIVDKAVSLIKLNILWILFSIPLFTGGAALCALHITAVRIMKNEEGYIAKGFLKAFKENFKQSTIMWIIFLLISIVFVVDFVSIKLMSDEIGGILQILFLFMGALLAAWMVYAFALQARFVNTVKNTLKNAMILVFAKLPFTVLIVLLTVGPVLVTFLTVRTLVIGVMVWFFAGVSLVAWLNSYLLRFVFKKLEEGGEQESQKEEIS